MVELRGVSKTIKNKVVLDDISYRFDDRMVYGLHGINGSGKTMLLRMISGLIIPDEGEVLWNGKVLHRDVSFPGNVGIVIENMELLPQYTAFENLRQLAKIRNEVDDRAIKEGLERVGLADFKDVKVKKFSLGMKQRLNIAQAIFEKQDLILLDEPTNALDEEGVQQVYEIIREEKERGATVVIATHHMGDLKTMCDVVLEIRQGRIE